MNKVVWSLRQPFGIAGRRRTETQTLVVEISEQQHLGRGEGVAIHYLGDDIEKMQQAIDAATPAIEGGIDRDGLLDLMPAGGARNAVDCALWDLEAQLGGTSIWDLTGVPHTSITTAFTIGIESSAEEMATKAVAADDMPILKVKLDSHQPLERLAAIRQARPDATLVVDANQALTIDQLTALMPKFAALNIAMLEQPLKRGHDQAIATITAPYPICADESCQDRADLARLPRGYSMINIKLDKAGGLTEALRLAREAKNRGLKIMVGNMTNSSLGSAPAMVIAALADFVDLDGPLLHREDWPGGLEFEGPTIIPPQRGFWGNYR